MVAAAKYLTPEVAEKLRTEISESGGSEIFAVLKRQDPRGVFDQLTVVARGTGVEVPALMSRVQWGDMTVHNHPTGVLNPSQADMQVATLFGEEGAGSMIVDNGVQEAYVIVEPAVPVNQIDVSADEISGVFDLDGALSRQMVDFEPREGQVRMAQAVAEAINQGRILTVEAGTGTGKSLAYLVPAMLWAQGNKKRVVIATKTIALQEQLIFKDIPLARGLMRDPPHAALIKGRSNYVCLRKLNDVINHQLGLFDDDEEGDKKEIKQLAEWVREHQVGDRSDLPFLPTKRAWDAIQSDGDMCLGAKCPHFQQSPFYVSRREAARARILVVNQALLFADLAIRESTGNHKAAAVIPPYDVVVMDEAHTMEDVATDHFAKKISSFGLRLALGRLISGRGSSGVIVRLQRFVMQSGLTEVVESVAHSIVQIREAQESLSQALEAMAAELHEVLNPERASSQEVWLNESLLRSGRLAEAKNVAQELLVVMSNLIRIARNLKRRLNELDDEMLAQMEGIMIEFEARIARLDHMAVALQDFAVKHDPDVIPWVELRRFRNGRMEFEYRVSPLDISPALRKALYHPFHSVVLTSATLDLDDDFAFFANRSGLTELTERSHTVCRVPSPFDYVQQARLVVPHLGSQPDQGAFAQHVAELVIELAELGSGGTLVLFTSYAMLNKVAQFCEGPLAARGIDLLVQGREQRSILIHRMKQAMGVLLGTDSFWEGVDLPGLALSKLVVTKLPFTQINDPIFAARSEAVRRRGGQPFPDYALPLALLKFKQGAGRLIRHRTDQGLLFVTDRRILEKSYGARFIKQVEQYPLFRRWPIPQEDQLSRI